MFDVQAQWNPLHTRLKEIIGKKEYFEEVKELLLQIHSMVHSSIVYEDSSTMHQKEKTATYMDEIWDGLMERAFQTMPTKKDNTIAWAIWHITRIEDLTANYLMAGQEQVLDEVWHQRLNTEVTDTGNAMTDDEILALSKNMDRGSLYEYRNAVGKRTRELILNLKPEDMIRKVSKAGIDRIAQVGGVINHPDSIWLLDFWGRKTIGGIILMPITRHQIVHLNECHRYKDKLAKVARNKNHKTD